MRLDEAKVRELLRKCDFETLFAEKLGWNRCSVEPLSVHVDDEEYSLQPIAELAGLVALRCDGGSDGRIPDYHVRRKIDRQVSRLHYEHIIIYCGSDQQVWQWVKKEQGKPSASREHVFRYDQFGTPLIQKLDGIAFTMEEHENGEISITSVAERVRSALDVDKVTRRFYDRFKVELAAFKGFVRGMTNTGQLDWYASVMLNRLMFIYFIQKKGFLDRDPNYLRNRLRMVQEKRGENQFYSFYRSFLRVLFHEGLNSRSRTAKLDELLGDVPYLNGGLFEEHKIEQQNPDLDIEDEAFERLFEFFDQYEWHLDTRPMRNDREINPDVLGYIFEKFVNQKQMGAYYTKEDITEYISKNTIIPRVFDAARKKCAIAFEGDQSVWTLLKDDPDSYIYPAMKLGVIDGQGNVVPESALPDFVQVGMHDPNARMFDKRYNLTEADLRDADGTKLTLPTETWREYVNHRNRCLEVREKLKAGEVRSIDDLITLNLDIRQFAQDVIENSEGPELLRAFYSAISSVTVLDPTCGSGAFLFAALNILEPLYEGCLERMQEFVNELDSSQEKHDPRKYSDFRKTLDAVGKHPNRPYFIFRSIILNNLYGVDIMPEAVEICKLRLFLKLAAQVDPDQSKPNMGLEPLPDIDFNIRAGNTLVGFATYDDVKKAVTSKLDFDDTMAAIEEKAEGVDRLWQRFREQQDMPDGGEVTAADKEELRRRLQPLEDELNTYLAREYGIDRQHEPERYGQWLASHQPFHWFIEFHGIMRAGGFDVVIGNPPYVAYSKVRQDYTVTGFSTEPTGNLYAFVVERALRLLVPNGRFGMIVPIASVSTAGMERLQRLYRGWTQWHSHYAVRPGKLFVGVDMNLTITLIRRARTDGAVFVTGYRRWSSGECGDRPYIFSALSYVQLPRLPGFANPFPKLGSAIEASILVRMLGTGELLRLYWRHGGETVYYHSGGRYWRKALLQKLSSHYKPVVVQVGLGALVLDMLNSQLFYWYWIANSNCMDVVSREVDDLPVFALERADRTKAEELQQRLLEAYYASNEVRTRRGETISTEEVNFKVQRAKPVIDQIDAFLSEHYGFTDEELDFIINYDIKYRMGLGGDDGEEE